MLSFGLLLYFSTMLWAQTPAPLSVEKIIGNNDLITVQNDFSNLPEPLRRIAPAIVRIDFPNQNRCTGTHLGSGLVLTAGHCFFPRPKKSNIIRNGSCNEIFIKKHGESQSAQSRCITIHRATFDLRNDFAVLQMDQPPTAQVQLSQRSKSQIEYDLITTLSYPKGQNLKWSQSCVLNRLKNTPEDKWSGLKPNEFFHTCDTEEGSSGAAILQLNRGEWQLVGIHLGSAQGELEFNFGAYINEIRRSLKRDHFDFQQKSHRLESLWAKFRFYR